MKKYLGLKIDVDTYLGMQKGVPALLAMLGEWGLKGTFYLSIGPDASGRAVFELVRNPRFLKKMWRTNAVGLYGLKTALYGTLLPSPQIALSFPHLVRTLISGGHELQFHAWDHRRWQDELSRRSTTWIRDWFAKGMGGFASLTGYAPTSFGAPAWRVDDRVMEILGEYPFQYVSCTRAANPFVHEGCRLVEIPSDLPCLEETGRERAIDSIMEHLQTGDIHVLPLHAEVEGGIGQEYFRELMKRIRKTDYSIVPLAAIRESLKPDRLPVRKYRLEMLAGRAAPCAV